MSEMRTRISIAAYVDELSTFLGRSVRTQLITIVSGTLAAMLIVFLVSQMLPATYTATTDVRLARIDGADLMTPQATAAKMNLRTFLARALDSAGPAEIRDSRGQRLILDSFNARPKTTDSLTLVVRAASEQQARNALEAAVRQLNNDQEKLRSPLLSELGAELAAADANIASLTRIRESLATTDSITPSSGDPAALALRRVWLLDLTARNDEKLAAALAERRALAAKIGPTKTYPASLSDDDVTTDQTSPQPIRHAIFAGAIALLAMVLYAMIRMPGPARAD